MVPNDRRRESMRIPNGMITPRRAGVVALFYPNVEGIAHLLLILRKRYEGVHSGQIALPGGKWEKEDKDLWSTAVREAHEEVGADPNKVQMIRSLTQVYIPPSNFMMQPYVGLYGETPNFRADGMEVDALVEVPLSHFMDDSNVTTEKMATSYAREVTVPAFSLNGYVVWGATAMVLSEMKELLKEVF